MYVRMHSSGNCNRKKQDYQYDSNNYSIILTYIILLNLKVYSDFIISWTIRTWSEYDLNMIWTVIYYLLLGFWAYARWLWRNLCWATTKALCGHGLLPFHVLLNPIYNNLLEARLAQHFQLLTDKLHFLWYPSVYWILFPINMWQYYEYVKVCKLIEKSVWDSRYKWVNRYALWRDWNLTYFGEVNLINISIK